MSTLNIPQQQTSDKNVSQASSPAAHQPGIEHVDDLIPMSRSRRNSESNVGSVPAAASAALPVMAGAVSPGAPGSAAAQAGLVPLPQGPVQTRAENASLTSPVDWKEADQLKASDPHSAMTIIYVGKNKKPFHIHSDKLVKKSPYFKKMLAEDSHHTGSKSATVEQTSFEDLDDFGMGLFMHWLDNQGHLNGPHDFHSLAHYLSLYVLSRKFEIEALENQVMDVVRHYYAEQNMSAPGYRLDYIYAYTHGPNQMRTFLVSTAAFRALEEQPHPDLAAANPMLHQTFYAPGSHVSDSIKGVLAKHPDMAIDFIDELHVHEQTPKCKVERREPWQSDGPSDSPPPTPEEKTPAEKEEEAEKEAKEKEAKEKEAKEKDPKEMEAREKEAKEKEAKENDPKQKEAKEKEAKEKEAKEKEAKEKGAKTVVVEEKKVEEKPGEKKVEVKTVEVKKPEESKPSIKVPEFMKPKEEPKVVETKVVEEKKIEPAKPGETKVMEKKVEEKKETKPAPPAGPSAPTDPKPKTADLPKSSAQSTVVKDTTVTKTAEPAKPHEHEHEHTVVTETKHEHHILPEHHEHRTDETKSDDGLFKRWGRKVEGHYHEMKDKMHKKDEVTKHEVVKTETPKVGEKTVEKPADKPAAPVTPAPKK